MGFASSKQRHDFFFFQRSLPDSVLAEIFKSQLRKHPGSWFMLLAGSTIIPAGGLATEHLTAVCEQIATSYLMTTQVQ